MTDLYIPSLLITDYVMAMKNTMDKVWNCTISWQVNNALNTCNKPSIRSVHDLSINSLILVYQKKNANQLEK